MTTGVIKVECPRCGGDSADLRTEKYIDADNKHRVHNLAFCKTCGKKLIDEYNDDPAFSYDTVTCPFCHSADCKKISTASKVGKTLMWGVLAAGAVSKTWHCNNCGSNFG